MYFVLNCFRFNGVSCKSHCWWHRIIDRNKKNFFPNKNNLISTFFFTSLLIQCLRNYWSWPLSVFHGSTLCREQGWCKMVKAPVSHLVTTSTYTVYLGWLCCWFSPFACSERFFSGYSSFPLSWKATISKFQFNLEHTFTRVFEKA